MSARPLAAIAALFAAAVATSACHRRAPPDDTGVPAAIAPAGEAPAALPIDHLAPGELVEGTEEAFGLVLPREVRVERRQLGSVRAIGPVSVHSLVRYLRTRIAEGHREEGDAFASFEDVRLRGKPGVVFRIRMTELPPRGTLLEIDDVTPPPIPDLPNEAARWKQVGLTPSGKIADPTHLD